MNDRSCDTRPRLTYYRPQRSCGKVIFLQASVSHSVHRGEGRGVSDRYHPLQTPPWADTPQADTLLGRHRPAQCMLGYTPPWRPLQRTVRILLECILVIKTGHKLPKHYVMKISVYQKSSQKNISTR